MTAYHTINNHLILSFLVNHKCSKSIRDQYKINTHCITVLQACYLYSEYIDRLILPTRLQLFIGYYSHKRMSIYLSSLVSIGLITLAGKHYQLTQPGYKAIQDISVNYDQVIYNFCNKYNIEL